MRNMEFDIDHFVRTDDRDVEDLIDRARRHPLGIDFLRDGATDSVSAVFSAHAFVVEAARTRLGP